MNTGANEPDATQVTDWPGDTYRGPSQRHFRGAIGADIKLDTQMPIIVQGHRTPSARKGSHLIILNRIEKYAALLARQCDDHAGTNTDIETLLPWDEA